MSTMTPSASFAKAGMVIATERKDVAKKAMIRLVMVEFPRMLP